MPLNRTNVTAASRIMLPLYPLCFIPLGLMFLLQSSARTSGPVYDVARYLAPMWVWGIVFMLVGLIEVAALLVHNRRVYVFALTCGAGLSTFWGCLIFAAAVNSPVVSFTGGWWYLIPIAAHLASARSVARKEHS